MTELRYRALFEHSHIGIVIADAQSVYLDANPSVCRMFGYTREEFIGLNASDIVVAEERDHIQEALSQLDTAHHHRREWLFRRKDGSVFPGEVVATPLPDGTILGIIYDASDRVRADAEAQDLASVVASSRDTIALLERREREVEQLSRLYDALSQVNHALIFTPDQRELFATVCRVLVERGGLALASIEWPDATTGRLRPTAQFGDVNDSSARDDDPASVAFRTKEPYIVDDVLAEGASPARVAQRDARGFRSFAAFPIRIGGSVSGVLSVYSTRPGFFQDPEIALLEEVANNIAFGLESFARAAARQVAEETLRNEKSFSDAMLESMPGMVYFYDANGRFLRWNRNMEEVSGYARDEIAQMHPLEFFTPAEQPLVAARIAEVLETGESWVEADLRSKDGHTTPYFFTGRRFVFDGMPCLVGVGVDVSDRKRAEGRLAESEHKYRELVENANSIILRWSSEGRITFLNEFGLRFFGYAAEEIVGRHVVGTLVPTEESGGRNLSQLMESVLNAPGAFARSINENVRRSGERVWIAWTNRIVRNAAGDIVEILSIGSDITEQRRAQARLRESEAHLREAQRIGRMGSWSLDFATNTLRWSEQIQELFGIDRSQFGGPLEDFLDFVHPDDRERLLAALQMATTGRARLDIEHRIVLRNRTERWVHEVADIKRDEHGTPRGLAGTVHDVTDRRRLEAEREQRHRAETADRVKSAFLATMSHELRTPLNSIIGFTGIMLQGLTGPLNAEQLKQLDMVRGSARHLLALVNDVLDISKIEAGQLDVAQHRFDVRRSIIKVEGLVRPSAAAKGLTFDVEVASDVDTMVSDERRFEQILINLLSNAIKFTERGAVRLCADVVPAEGTGASPSLRVRVRDTGIGIKRDDLATLFQPFRQLDSGLARQHDGTGLGLAICRRLATIMHGDIAVESESTQGSTFTLTLPLARPSVS